MSDIADKNVFMSSVFYSLESVLGGAVFTNVNTSIKNCRFANNTADDGSDVYVTVSTTYFSDPMNIQNTCSLSLTPGRLSTIDVCFYCF
jgi:hypothetical protein